MFVYIYILCRFLVFLACPEFITDMRLCHLDSTTGVITFPCKDEVFILHKQTMS